MTDVRVRPAGPADLDAFMDLWRHAQRIQHAFRPFRTTVDPDDIFRARFLETVELPDHVWLAAEADGRVVGMAYLHPEKPSGMSDDLALEISRVSVDPAARGQGIGRALVAEAERIARERGIRFLSARIFTQNADALRFWNSVGFESLYEMHVRKLD